MKITVKLFAGFRRYLPDGTGVEGITMEIDNSITINQILDQFHVPVAEAHLVLINGNFISPENRNCPVFTDNDILAVWPAVAGG
jgi:sulfur carrier protein ThiS